MRPLIFAALLSISPFSTAQTKSRAFWDNALAWFLFWNTSEPVTNAGAACQASIVGREKVQFDCAEEIVVAEIGFIGADCVIRFMRRAFSDEVSTQAEPIADQELSRMNGCIGQTANTRTFRATVRIRPSQGWNGHLSQDARDKAISYSKRTGLNGCTLHIPKIYSGDPFFHVYRVCSGTIDSVWEFPIVGEIAATYAHWTYTRQRENLPPGAVRRLQNTSLWFASSDEIGLQPSPNGSDFHRNRIVPSLVR